MRVLEDPSPGDWIASRLQGWGIVGGTVPRGYPAIARVLHPPELTRGLGDGPRRSEVQRRPVRWAEVAEHHGRVAHPAMQWGSLTGARDEHVPWRDGWLLHPPEVGNLERPTFTALLRLLAATTGTDSWIAAVWTGWGELHAGAGSSVELSGSSAEQVGAGGLERSLVPAPLARAVAAAGEGGHVLRLPDREYVLIAARPAELASDAWFSGLGSERPRQPAALTPNLLWPEDRAWCMATEIDFDSTLVAGDRALVDALLASHDLEAVEVTEDTDLTWTGDEVNPYPAS